MKKAFVARNHNGTLIAWNVDIGNLMEEVMFYEEMTGNSTSIGEEQFENEPSHHRPEPVRV